MKNKSTWLIIISAGLLFLTSITGSSDNMKFSMKETLYTIMAIGVGIIGVNLSSDNEK